MRRINFEDELLFWIAADVEARSRGREILAVPIQLLMTRLAVRNQQQDSELTQSTVLSLQSFERATLFRSLKLLHSKEFIHFVDKDGKVQALELGGTPASPPDEWKGPGFVTATESGIERAEIIARKFNL